MSYLYSKRLTRTRIHYQNILATVKTWKNLPQIIIFWGLLSEIRKLKKWWMRRFKVFHFNYFSMDFLIIYLINSYRNMFIMLLECTCIYGMLIQDFHAWNSSPLRHVLIQLPPCFNCQHLTADIIAQRLNDILLRFISNLLYYLFLYAGY